MTLLIISTLLKFKIIRSLISPKCLKTTVQLTFTTQKANACSPWTAWSIFYWKYLFWGTFVPKTQNYQFMLKFCTWTNSNMQNSMTMFTFSVFDGKKLFGQIWSKNENCQLKQKFGTKRRI